MVIIMANEKKKKKLGQQGIPVNRLFKGGEAAQGGKAGRKHRRVVASKEIASQAVSHIGSFLSTFHGELFEKQMPDWLTNVLSPLATITDASMQIRFTSGTLVAIGFRMDPGTFEGENGMLDLINRINKRLARQQIANNFPPQRSISFAYYTDKVVQPGHEYNRLGDEFDFCIVATLPGAYNLPSKLPSSYAEYFLQIGYYRGVNPITNDQWLEENRTLFSEFSLVDANPLLDVDTSPFS